MNVFSRLAVGIAAALGVMPALAMPVDGHSAAAASGDSFMTVAGPEAGYTHKRHHLHRRRPVPEQRDYPSVQRVYPRDDGGYVVNRYGYGNYIGGPDGGFAGYPAGSPGAFVYQQRETWKCEYAPETC